MWYAIGAWFFMGMAVVWCSWVSTIRGLPVRYHAFSYMVLLLVICSVRFILLRA